MLHEPRVELAHALRQEPQQAVGDRRRGEDDLAEHRRRHDADLAACERGDVRRAADPVDRGELAEHLPAAHLAEDDLLAGLGADQDAHVAGGEEIDVG